VCRWPADEETPDGTGAEVAGMSVFSRLRLGRDISITANTLVNRLPLFQRLKLVVGAAQHFRKRCADANTRAPSLA
jgi:hypothetical protein